MAKKTKKLSKLNAALILLIGIIGAIVGFKMYRQNMVQIQPADLAVERMKGNLNSSVRIVEFIDFQCPACAVGAVVLSEFIKKHPDLIQVELKYFPLQGHSHGFLSAMYAECSARQGMFWAMHDKLIDRQKQWSVLNDAKPAFNLYAQEIGIEINQLKSCLAEKHASAYIRKNQAEGQALGVRSTPSYFINNKLYVGAKSLQLKLKKIVKSASILID